MVIKFIVVIEFIFNPMKEEEEMENHFLNMENWASIHIKGMVL